MADNPVLESNQRTQVTPASGQTVLNYNFRIDDESWMTVYYNSETAPLVLNTDYTVQGVGVATGGTITLLTRTPDGSQIVTMEGNPTIDRPNDYQRGGDYFASTVNEEEDKQFLIMQALRRDISRAASVPPQAPDDVSGQLPVPEANRSIIWAPDAKSLVNGPNADEIQNAQGYAEQAAAAAEYVSKANWKQSVRVATTANITLSGLQTIDGVSVTAGMRVLVKDQTNAAENGIYDANASAWKRAVDADTWLEVVASAVQVEEGTQNTTSQWKSTAVQGGTLGTTALNYEPFGGSASVIIADTRPPDQPSGTLVIGTEQADLTADVEEDTGPGAGNKHILNVGPGMVGVNGQYAPVGSIVWLPYAEEPAGFKAANYQLLSTTTYAELFAKIGYSATKPGDPAPPAGLFRVPDLRSRTVYGADLGEGFDPTLTTMSYHDDQMQQITGTISARSGATNPTGAFTAGANSDSEPFTGGSNGYQLHTFDSANSPGARTGPYTRARATVLYPLIKTHDGVINHTALLAQTIIDQVDANSAKFGAKAYIADVKASGTAAGTNSVSRATRTLNTVVYDPHSIVTLASDQFTPAVACEVSWRSPHYQTDSYVTWLYNVTDAVDVDIGSTGYSQNASGSTDHSFGRAIVEAGKTYRIDYQSTTANASSGLGVPHSFGNNVYTQVWLEAI